MLDLCWKAVALGSADKIRYREQIKQLVEQICSYQKPDGTWSMELSMTSGGVTTTYAGVLAGDQATGKVTEDGKKKGSFVIAR